VRQLRGEVGGLSVQLAERLIGESLADDARRSATVDAFLAELDSLATREPAPAGGAS
jgi:F-type H+-transporting ATPase subunit b